MTDDMSLAIADDLLHCDWLCRIWLITTWAVCHLVIATLGMIGGDALRAVWLTSKVSRYLSTLSMYVRIQQENAIMK